MEKFKIIKILIVGLFFYHSAHSYDISELVKILIDKNETNSSFNYDELIDELTYKNVDTLYIPTIDYSYTRTNSTSSTTSTSTTDSNINSISATVNLYNGGFGQLNLIATESRNQALNFLRQYQKELLIKELIHGYNNLQSLVEKKKRQNENIVFYQNRVQEAEILFNANRISKIDLLDFQNELINAQTLLLDFDRQIDNLMLQVNKLLDLEVNDEDINFDLILDINNQLIKKKSFKEILDSSYGQYLEYLEKTYLPELEMGKKDLRPSVDLTYSLTDNDQFSNSVDHRRASTLSLQVSIPLYDGFKDENEFDISKYEYQKKLLDHKDLQKDLHNTYIESWNNHNYYNQKIENQKKIIESLELKLKGNEILYKSQKISVTELIESKNELNNAKNVLLDLDTQNKYYLLDILILNADFNKLINGLG